MSDEKKSVEVSKDFLKNLFNLMNMPVPDDITEAELGNIVEDIKDKMSDLTNRANTPPPASQSILEKQSSKKSAYLSGGEQDKLNIRPKNALIIDDLGIITYQLEMLFKKLGFEVTISNEINDAIDKFKKQDFGYVIMDLFIPTEREGFILLDEIKKLILLCKLNTLIVVMTASSKDEHKKSCKNHGADVFIEKNQGWQKELIEICMNN